MLPSPIFSSTFSEFSSDPVELAGMVEGVRLCDAWDIPVDRTSLPPWAPLYMTCCCHGLGFSCLSVKTGEGGQ